MNFKNTAFGKRTADGQPFMNFGSHLAAPGNDDQYKMKPVPVTINEPVGRFIAVVAHEIRNPLTNINLSAELMRSQTDDENLKLYLDIIVRNSVRVNNLITELLEYLQTSEAKTESHSIHQLLDAVLLATADRAALKKIVVTKEYIADHKRVFSERGMTMALTNIVINAIDAMTPRKGILKIVTKEIGGKYVVQIDDNGCGIKEENLKYLFTPYFSSKPEGLGLGLAMAYSILRSNSIGLNVRSKEGEGTCFNILF